MLRATCSTTPTTSADEFRERVEAEPAPGPRLQDEDWQDVIERAPQLTEHLGDDAARALRAVQRGSTRSASRTSSRRGSSAASTTTRRTTFEFVGDALDAAQNAVGGGGRYDQLAEEMGGPPTPGIGFGIGIERVLIAGRRARRSLRGSRATRLDAFVVDGLGDGDATRAASHELREAGLRADRAYGGRS